MTARSTGVTRANIPEPLQKSPFVNGHNPPTVYVALDRKKEQGNKEPILENDI